MIYYTSDTHFGHQSIIKFCNRPFATADEMDEELIRRWNERVRPEDEVYHLGDFAFRNAKHADTYLSRLNGTKHLIWGNHDTPQVKNNRRWASSRMYAEVADQGRVVVLFHYPINGSWNKSFHGSFHLYGHVHGTVPGVGRSTDAGVDCCDFYPMTLDELIVKMPEPPKQATA